MTHQYPRRSLSAIIGGLPVSRLNSLEDARILCEYIGFHANADLRVQCWDLSVQSLNPFKAAGFISNPTSLISLEAALRHFGVEYDLTEVLPLPDPALGNRRFGLVAEPRCPIYFAPIEASERLDTALYGASLFLLRREAEFAFVHSPSGYVGWVRTDCIKEIALEEWLDWARRPRALLNQSIESEGARIPANAILPLADDRESILTLDGRELPLPAGSMTSPHAQSDRNALYEAALSLQGVPYVWGGNDADGIDCSGFVRFCYRVVGHMLPRDADMQLLAGRVAAMPGSEAGMELGDLLFFTGEHGRVTHVAMALDSERFIHASTAPGVAIDAFTANEALRSRFLMAKRILL